MSSPPFEKLAVLGLGLLGGSVAAAVKQRGLAREVVGAARRRAPLNRAREAGIVDSVASPLSKPLRVQTSLYSVHPSVRCRRSLPRSRRISSRDAS